MNSESDSLDIAVIGLGQMGRYHYEALKNLSSGDHESYYKGGVERFLHRLNVVAACDPDPARRMDDTVPFYTDHRELLDRHRPFIAVVAAPTSVHYAITTDCLQKGAHTYVEKPLAPSVREALDLKQLAFEKRLRLLSGHVERFNPVSVMIKEILAGGEFGAPLWYAFHRVQSHPERIRDDVITDKLIHDVDLALNFFGKLNGFRVIDSQRRDGLVYEINAELRHESGAVGTVFTSWLVDEKSRTVDIEFHEHTLRADFLTKEYFVDGVRAERYDRSMVRQYNNQIKDELVDFIALCVGLMDGDSHVEPILTLDDVIASLQVVDMARHPEP